MYKLDLEKAEEPEIKLVTSAVENSEKHGNTGEMSENRTLRTWRSCSQTHAEIKLSK